MTPRAKPAPARAPAPRCQHRPRGDHPQRARRAPPRSPARRASGGGGRRRRHHRAPAGGSAPHLGRRHRPAQERADPAAQSGDGGDRRDAGASRCATCRTPAAWCPRSARRRPPKAGSMSCAARTTCATTWRRSKAPASACRCSSSPTRRRSRLSARLGAQVVELHTGAYCERALDDDAAGVARELARLERAARSGRGRRPRGARRPRAHVQHRRRGRADPPDRRAQHRPFPGRGGDLQRPAAGHRAHAHADGRSAPADRGRKRRKRAMILGIGNDVIDIRRIEKTIERFGDRFLHRIFTEAERARSDGTRGPRCVLCQAVCGQGGVRQGAGNRVQEGRVLAATWAS